MYISKLAFEKIKEFEGCKLQAYQDAAGVWTIGYGHTYNVREVIEGRHRECGAAAHGAARLGGAGHDAGTAGRRGVVRV